MKQRLIKSINLVGESLSLADALSCELIVLLNSSLANDRVLTSGDFSECSDSEFSCSELTERPLKWYGTDLIGVRSNEKGKTLDKLKLKTILR